MTQNGDDLKCLTKSANEPIRVCEDRSAVILHTTMDGFCLVDMQGRLLEVNDAFCRMTGYSHDEVLSRSILDFEADESVDEIQAHIQQVAKARFGRFERRLWCKDGRAITVDVSVNYQAALGGRLFCFVRDITSYRQATDSLRESEDRFRIIASNTPDHILIQDHELRYRFVANPQLGLTEADMLGKTDLDFLDREDAAKLTAIKRRVMETGERFHVEVPLTNQKGEREYFDGYYIPKYDRNGKSDGIIGYFRNITERKRMEVELRESEERFRGYFDLDLIGMAVTSLNKEWLLINNRFCEILGYSREELLRKTWADLTHPEDLYKDEQQFNRVLQGEIDGYRMEKRYLRADGSVVHTDLSVKCMRHPDGRVRHFVAMVQDITERKELEEKLRQSQKLEAIGQLAGGVAHDFNNIMAAIMMQLSMLQTNASFDFEAMEIVKELMAEAKRAAALTRQLLMFSRRSVLEIKTLNLNDVVANLLKMLASMIGERVRLQFAPSDTLPVVEADARMVEQVIMNLAVNARDAMPNGGSLAIEIAPVRIDCETRTAHARARTGSFMCLSVSDTGCGMDEKTLKSIFEPFFTTKEVGKGTGLGLAAVHGIMAQHNGWVDVESTPGRGSCFKAFFPASSKTPDEPPVPREKEIVRGCETLLLVEDENGLRYLVAKALRRLDYKVLEADSGLSALALWEKHADEIDLLFSDMILSEGMTGLDLAVQLRKSKPLLKVIVSSGYNVDLARHGLPDDGSIVFLPKPYDIDIISKAVRDSLGKGASAPNA